MKEKIYILLRKIKSISSKTLVCDKDVHTECPVGDVPVYRRNIELHISEYYFS
jgi:hypothetical protein